MQLNTVFAHAAASAVSDLPSTREEAKSLGLSRYFDVKAPPCRNGHLSPRRTKDGYCIACKRAAEKRRLDRRAQEQLE